MVKTLSFIGTAFLVGVASYGQIITYDLTFSQHAGGPSTLVGNMTIDTSDLGASTDGPFLPLPSWLQSVNFSYTAGGTTTTYSRSDFTGLSWLVKNLIGGPDNWNADLVPQFNNINFIGLKLNGVDSFLLQHTLSGDQFNLTSAVPAPVPEPGTYAFVFGMGLVGFALYRKRAGRLHRLNPAL